MMKVTCAVDEIERLAPGKIKTLLDKDRKGEFLLLDVRQPEEYESEHVPGATLIPLGELKARQDEPDRSKKIITYCRSGRRNTGESYRSGHSRRGHLCSQRVRWGCETSRQPDWDGH